MREILCRSGTACCYHGNGYRSRYARNQVDIKALHQAVVFDRADDDLARSSLLTSQRVIDSEGWFATGDVGTVDADGFLSITGRAKEMLIIGGENVFPREIEAVLESHGGVAQAAVIGIPDDLRGEAAIAFVIPDADESISEADLRQHAKKTLAGFKIPKQIIVREDLPVGPTGKIVKRQLAALLSS